MGMEMGKKNITNLIIGLFKTITRAKKQDVLQKEVEDANESAKQKAPMLERL